jgi:D-glucosaminate PTS system EIIB component
MPIQLYRIDDRLIHGQVVLGWGRSLGVRFIVLVDDDVAASAWEQDLYRMALPPDIEPFFVGVAEGRAHLAQWNADPRPGILLTGRVETMAALLASNGGAPIRVNLGGIHHRPGRIERLPYVYLTEEELRALKALRASGADVTAQDVPTSAPVALDDLG